MKLGRVERTARATRQADRDDPGSIFFVIYQDIADVRASIDL